MTLTPNWPNLPATKLALAVSGGGDSVAMLRLFVRDFPQAKPTVLHFNHQLRESAAEDAAFVQQLAAAHSLPCVVGTPGTPLPRTNLQQAARQARYAFFAEACAAGQLAGVLVAHTSNDQLETFMLRQLRGSGLRGLQGMAVQNKVQGVSVWRPLLHTTRSELEGYLKELKQNFITDPANSNTRFLRTQVRAALAQKPFAAHTSALHASQQALAAAQQALDARAHVLWQRSVRVQGGSVIWPDALLAHPPEVLLALLVRTFNTLMPGTTVPRRSKQLALLHVLAAAPASRTLGGLKVRVKATNIIFSAA